MKELKVGDIVMVNGRGGKSCEPWIGRWGEVSHVFEDGDVMVDFNANLSMMFRTSQLTYLGLDTIGPEWFWRHLFPDERIMEGDQLRSMFWCDVRLLVGKRCGGRVVRRKYYLWKG